MNMELRKLLLENREIGKTLHATIVAEHRRPLEAYPDAEPRYKHVGSGSQHEVGDRAIGIPAYGSLF